MRILYDSKQLCYKDPFGTLTPNQSCTLHIHIPCSVGTTEVFCVFTREDGTEAFRVPMERSHVHGAYDIFQGTFQITQCGLYFYYFCIHKPDSSFRLFKQGNDTNMEAGDCWQLSCIPENFTTPQWAKGATIYQIFPDRFYRSGSCDLQDKLQPYILHQQWDEEVHWQPDEKGEILNNDFFGGNFRGITEKMEYISSLGTQILYLNPISKSFSNHRYDTGDYKTPDPMLGTLEDFSIMCQAAHDRGIRVVLDGVYSHTGANSLYFDKFCTFGGKGAYCDPASPYRNWYLFQQYPHTYKSWWGFDTLPTVDKMNPAFVEYVITGEDSVVAHWLRLGADGFRLDVADELPDAFIKLLKDRIRQIKPDALLIGEVWEDASNKISYDIRRRYFVDGCLDSCMNYPFRTAILNFIKGCDDGRALADTVMTIAENYPPQVLCCNMNLLGTHDTPRILTALVDDFDGTRAEKASRRLTPQQCALAKELLTLVSFLQFMLPGAPSIYYGDEAGMEGYKDPFNRRTYPWGKEDMQLLAHFRCLGALRKDCLPLRMGDIRFFQAGNQRIGFCRGFESRQLRIYVNLNKEPWEISGGELLLGHHARATAPNWLTLDFMGWCLMEVK